MTNIINKDLNRMRALMNIKPINENQKKAQDPVEYSKKGADGNFYGIVREGSKYYIKKATPNEKGMLVKENFDYIGGFMRRNENCFDSFSKAMRNLEGKLASLNEAVKAHATLIECGTDKSKNKRVIIEARGAMRKDIARQLQIMNNVEVLAESRAKYRSLNETTDTADTDATPFSHEVKNIGDTYSDAYKPSVDSEEGEYLNIQAEARRRRGRKLYEDEEESQLDLTKGINDSFADDTEGLFDDESEGLFDDTTEIHVPSADTNKTIEIIIGDGSESDEKGDDDEEAEHLGVEDELNGEELPMEGYRKKKGRRINERRSRLREGAYADYKNTEVWDDDSVESIRSGEADEEATPFEITPDNPMECRRRRGLKMNEDLGFNINDVAHERLRSSQTLKTIKAHADFPNTYAIDDKSVDNEELPFTNKQENYIFSVKPKTKLSSLGESRLRKQKKNFRL